MQFPGSSECSEKPLVFEIISIFVRDGQLCKKNLEVNGMCARKQCRIKSETNNEISVVRVAKMLGF